MEKHFAGYLDGQGCIGIYRAKRRKGASWHYILNCIFAQSRGDKMKILRDIKKIYGGCLIKIPKKKGCQRQWALRLTGWKALKLIKDTLPHMRVREKQARLAIEFMKYRKENNGNKNRFEKLPDIHLEYYEDCRKKMNWYNRHGTNF